MKIYNLTENQLGAYEDWLLKRHETFFGELSRRSSDYPKWLEENPCPLPEPIEESSGHDVNEFYPDLPK